jgi:hypothetical protein
VVEPYIPPSTQTDKHEELINELIERVKRLEYRLGMISEVTVAYDQDADEEGLDVRCGSSDADVSS